MGGPRVTITNCIWPSRTSITPEPREKRADYRICERFHKTVLEADHAVLFGIGGPLDDAGQFVFLLRTSFGSRPGALPLRNPLIESIHPIPQRLAVHAADAGRLLAALAFTHRRQSQKTSRLIGVLRFHGKLP